MPIRTRLWDATGGALLTRAGKAGPPLATDACDTKRARELPKSHDVAQVSCRAIEPLPRPAAMLGSVAGGVPPAAPQQGALSRPLYDLTMFPCALPRSDGHQLLV
jgi:hypothetical protein